jgi:hypothetical protein
MKEIKSKKSGLTQTVSDTEYAEIVNKRVIDLSRFTVTDVMKRSIIPSIKIPEVEVKITKKKKE